MKRSEILSSVLTIPVDLIALLAGFWLAYHFRTAVGVVPVESLGLIGAELRYTPPPSGSIQPIATYFHYLSYIIPGMLAIFGLVGLYRIRSGESWWRRSLHVLLGVSVGEAAILLLFLLKANFFLPRSTVLYSWLFCTVFVLVGRMVIRVVQKLLYRHGVGVNHIVVIGHGSVAAHLAVHFQNHPLSAYQLAARIEEDQLEVIIKKLEKLEVDELVILGDQFINEDLVTLRNYCLEQHVAFSFVPPLLTALDSTFEVRTLVGVPLVEVRPTPLEGWGRVLKRAFDLLAALFFILILSPVMLLIAIVMKLTSPGPLLYKHLRIGRNKQPIYVWKFRTFFWQYCTGSGYDGDAIFAEMLAKHPEMHEEWEASHKLKNDFRVHPLGKIMRKSSLDELPQFFNVLRGELSLVGPRPIVTDEVKKYGEKARILFTVRPGVTGPWQVSGRSDVSYAERIALDSHYIEHWNLGTDLLVVAKTCVMIMGDILNVVLRRKGSAY